MGERMNSALTGRLADDAAADEGEDKYSRTIDPTAEGMTMKINLSGTKIGTCDNPVG